MNDTVGRNVRFWTHLSVVMLCLGAWGGAALVYFESRFSVPFLLVGVGSALLAAWCTYGAVQEDPNLSESARQKISGWFKLAGPAAVVQLLLFIHFPNSRFAGH